MAAAQYLLVSQNVADLCSAKLSHLDVAHILSPLVAVSDASRVRPVTSAVTRQRFRALALPDGDQKVFPHFLSWRGISRIRQRTWRAQDTFKMNEDAHLG
jgi:hypothetical protein